MKKNAGFTLIEVILAVAVLSFVFLPLMGYFTDSARVNRAAMDKQNASFLAESLLETVRSVEVAEDLKTPLKKRGLTEVTETNRRETDYQAEYRGWSNEADQSYFVELLIDFAAEKENHNSGSEAELFPFSGTSDVIAAEGGQQEAAIDYFSDLNQQACAGMEQTPLSREEIRDYLSREMHMKIEKQETSEPSYKISVWYIYTCENALGCGDEIYDTSENSGYLCEVTKNVSDWECFYLYYNPLTGEDILELETEETDIFLDRFYLVCQTASGSSQRITFTGGNCLKNCTLYSNADVMQTTSALEKKGLIGVKDARRMARVTVSIYDKEPQAGETILPLVTMETKKGE